jgi:WD40 repeat protein
MNTIQDYQELLKNQCNLTDLFRNQLQVTNFELQKARGIIQHLKAVLVSLQSDLNIKSEHLSTLLDFIDKNCGDETRIAILEEHFKKSLSHAYSSCVSCSSSKLSYLSNDVVCMILEYLEPRELTSISYTCKEMYSMCQSSNLWKLLSQSRWSVKLDGKSDFLARYKGEMAWYHTRPIVSTLLSHSGSVTCLSYTPGKPYFISGSDDCSLSMWGIDESHLNDQDIVKQHHVQTKTILKKICYYGHGGPIWSCCEAPDNKLVSGSYDKTIKTWNLSTGRCESTMRGHSQWVSSVDCNSQIIISGSWDSTIKIWDQVTKQCITTYTFDNSVYCLQLYKDSVIVGLKSKVVEIWDINTSSKIISCFGHYKGINTVKMADHLAVTGSSDSLVKIWDLRTGECVDSLAGHTSNVMCLDFDIESRRLATGSYDKTIRIWDMRKNNSARTVLRGHSDPVFCLKFDDHKLISGSMDQSIKIWNFHCIN